jgi:hypothetical protein
MDNPTGIDLFRILPTELIEKLLAMLPYHDLASCMLVRRPCSLGITTAIYTLLGVLAHGPADTKFVFVTIPYRIGQIRYGRWIPEQVVSI